VSNGQKPSYDLLKLIAVTLDILTGVLFKEENRGG